MSPCLVLVTDTNIWIDLNNGGILREVFFLPYHLVAPDFVVEFELIRPGWEALQTLGLELVSLEAPQILELIELRSKTKTISIYDLAAFLVAKREGGILLTGDRRLANFARGRSIQVHGVLWLLDEMVRMQLMAPDEAINSLDRMLKEGARLPLDECNKRFRIWSLL